VGLLSYPYSKGWSSSCLPRSVRLCNEEISNSPNTAQQNALPASPPGNLHYPPQQQQVQGFDPSAAPTPQYQQQYQHLPNIPVDPTAVGQLQPQHQPHHQQEPQTQTHQLQMQMQQQIQPNHQPPQTPVPQYHLEHRASQTPAPTHYTPPVTSAPIRKPVGSSSSSSTPLPQGIVEVAGSDVPTPSTPKPASPTTKLPTPEVSKKEEEIEERVHLSATFNGFSEEDKMFTDIAVTTGLAAPSPSAAAQTTNIIRVPNSPPPRIRSQSTAPTLQQPRPQVPPGPVNVPILHERNLSVSSGSQSPVPGTINSPQSAFDANSPTLPHHHTIGAHPQQIPPGQTGYSAPQIQPLYSQAAHPHPPFQQQYHNQAIPRPMSTRPPQQAQGPVSMYQADHQNLSLGAPVAQGTFQQPRKMVVTTPQAVTTTTTKTTIRPMTKKPPAPAGSTVSSGAAMAAQGLKTMSKASTTVIKKAFEDSGSFWVPKKRLKEPVKAARGGSMIDGRGRGAVHPARGGTITGRGAPPGRGMQGPTRGPRGRARGAMAIGGGGMTSVHPQPMGPRAYSAPAPMVTGPMHGPIPGSMPGPMLGPMPGPVQGPMLGPMPGPVPGPMQGPMPGPIQNQMGGVHVGMGGGVGVGMGSGPPVGINGGVQMGMSGPVPVGMNGVNGGMPMNMNGPQPVMQPGMPGGVPGGIYQQLATAVTTVTGRGGGIVGGPPGAGRGGPPPPARGGMMGGPGTGRGVSGPVRGGAVGQAPGSGRGAAPGPTRGGAATGRGGAPTRGSRGRGGPAAQQQRMQQQQMMMMQQQQMMMMQQQQQQQQQQQEQMMVEQQQQEQIMAEQQQQEMYTEEPCGEEGAYTGEEAYGGEEGVYLEGEVYAGGEGGGVYMEGEVYASEEGVYMEAEVGYEGGCEDGGYEGGGYGEGGYEEAGYEGGYGGEEYGGGEFGGEGYGGEECGGEEYGGEEYCGEEYGEYAGGEEFDCGGEGGGFMDLVGGGEEGVISGLLGALEF